MIYRRSYALLSVLVALLLAALACGGPSTAATATTSPTLVSEATTSATAETEPTPSDVRTVQITSLHGYVDLIDTFQIVGLIYNDTTEAVSAVELTVSVVDANGDTVLVDENGTYDDDSDDFPLDSVIISPRLNTLAPGETSPFDYWVIDFSASATDMADWQFEVEVTNWEAGETDRAKLEVINDQVLEDEEGHLVIVGELANLSDEAVLVNGLAAARLDDSGLALAADGAAAFTHYLAPAGDEAGHDRTPFRIHLNGPAHAATQTNYYWDADLAPELNTASDLAIDFSDSFWSSNGDLHMLLQVTNNGSDLVSGTIVVGQYAEDGTVLDAAEADFPIAIEAGTTMPIYIEYFGNFREYTDFPLLREALATYTVQFDPARTAVVAGDLIYLDTVNEVGTSYDDGRTVGFDGEVVNLSDQGVMSATVILSIYDPDKNLVTANSVIVGPVAGSLAANQSAPFEIRAVLPFGVDWNPDNLVTFTVRGYPDLGSGEVAETEATQVPEAQATAEVGIVAGELSVASLHGYLDPAGYYHVAGLLYNDTELILKNLTVYVEVLDAAGNQVAEEYEVHPLLDTVAPGETIPFEYELENRVTGADLDASDDWTYQAIVILFEVGEANRPELEVVNDQLLQNPELVVSLAGELVNLSDEPVLVSGMAAALLDASDLVVAVAEVEELTYYLAPAGDENGYDRTPFAVQMFGPGKQVTADIRIVYYWDANVTDALDTATDLEIVFLNSFWDAGDGFHVMAEVTNNGEETVFTSMVAGLYAEDGKVLDAAAGQAYLMLEPGATVSVQFDTFNLLDSHPSLQDQLDAYTVQFDASKVVEIESLGATWVVIESANVVQGEQGEYSVSFTGDVVNTSDLGVSLPSVVLSLYDGEGNLVTTGNASSADQLVAGQRVPFELTLFLPWDADLSTYTFRTMAGSFLTP